MKKLRDNLGALFIAAGLAFTLIGGLICGKESYNKIMNRILGIDA